MKPIHPYQTKQNPGSHRLIIYTKDVMLITGRKERTARKMLSAIRKKFKKNSDAMVSIDEFCEFTGLRIEKVQQSLLD